MAFNNDYHIALKLLQCVRARSKLSELETFIAMLHGASLSGDNSKQQVQS